MASRADAQRLLALDVANNRGMLSPVQKAAYNELRARLSKPNPYAEVGATMLSGALAEPVSGFVGMAAAPYGSDVATRAINKTQEGMTYQPRTDEGQQKLQGLMEFMQPVTDAFMGASEYLGDTAYDLTGSPTAGAAAYSIPTMGLELLGLKGAGKVSGKRFEMGDIGQGNVGSNQRGIFAGIKAKTADMGALDKAQDMAAQGASRDEIWDQTGWFKDVDGGWKFEIDDSAARYRGEGFTENPEFKQMEGTAGSVIPHDQLYRAYPDASGITVSEPIRRQAKGMYNRELDHINISPEVAPGQPIPESLMSTFEPGERSVMLHELQHGIQGRENFARGGMPEVARYALRDAEDAAKRPLSGAANEVQRISRRLDPLTKADYINKLNKIIGSESPKPSSVTNMSDFYRYSDEIRDTFGAMPNKASAARDEWVKSAAQYIRRKNLDDMGGQMEVEIRDMLRDPAQVKKDLRSLERQRDKLIPKLREYQDVDRKFRGLNDMEDFKLYERLVGEAEARNVQTRMDMTPEQRQAQPPWQTLDVPEDELIVRKGGGTMQSAPKLSPDATKRLDLTRKAYYGNSDSILDGSGKLTRNFDDALDEAVESGRLSDADADFAYGRTNSDFIESDYIPLNAKDADKAKKVVRSKQWMHGTPDAEFAANPSPERPLFLTSDPDAARTYAKGGEVKQMQVEPKRPFFIESTDSTYDMEASPVGQKALKDLADQGYDSVVPLDYGDIIILSPDALKR